MDRPIADSAVWPDFRAKYPHLEVVHSPVHASWLNGIEIYFSVLRRKALTPDDFVPWLNSLSVSTDSSALTKALPHPWKFTGELAALLEKLKPF